MNTYKTLESYLKSQMKQRYLQKKKEILRMDPDELIPYTNFRLWYSYTSKPEKERDLSDYREQIVKYQHEIYLDRQKRALSVLRHSYDALPLKKIDFLSVVESYEFAGAAVYSGEGKESRKEAYGLYPEKDSMSGFGQVLNSNASARKWLLSKLNGHLESHPEAMTLSVPDLCRAVFGEGGAGEESETGAPAFSGNLVEILIMFERNGAEFQKQDIGGTITF
ncbi:MAG: hypothetical protein SPL63_07960 [Roseburia faecis]|nr:hypothetical protein [Roseburia faecis]